MSRQGEGIVTGLLRVPRPVNLECEQFSLRLFFSAQICTCLSSLVLVSELVAGTMTFGMHRQQTIARSRRTLGGGQMQ